MKQAKSFKAKIHVSEHITIFFYVLCNCHESDIHTLHFAFIHGNIYIYFFEFSVIQALKSGRKMENKKTYFEMQSDLSIHTFKCKQIVINEFVGINHIIE